MIQPSFFLTDNEKKLIQNEALEAEQKGGLSPAQLDLIYEKRWFHLLVPKNCGGKELSLPMFSHFMEEVAAVDGSFAWAINLGAGANMFAGYLSQSTAQDLFTSPKTCIAGSGAIGGTAIKENKGYHIDGHWKYASGSGHANYFSLNAYVDEEKTTVKSFLVPEKAVECIDTWKVFGLKATGSLEFKVENAWVPESYCFDLQNPSPWAAGALYRFPFNTLAEINMLVMTTGMAKHFMQLAEEITRQKTVGSLQKEVLWTHPHFKLVFEKMKANFEAKRKYVFEQLEDLWLKTEGKKTIPPEALTEFTQSVLQSAEAARNLVDGLYPFLGLNPVFTESSIGKVYQDFKVGSQHALLSPLRK